MTSDVESKSGNRLDLKSRIGFDLLFGIVPLSVLLPLLTLEFRPLWQRDATRYFPIPILLVASFALLQLRSPKSINSNRVFTSRFLFLVSVSLFGIAVWQFSPWIAHGCLALFFASWAIERLGVVPWPRIIAWVGLLATSMRLPRDFDLILDAWIVKQATAILSTILDGLAVPYVIVADAFSMRGLEFMLSKCCESHCSIHALASAIVLLLILTHRSLIVAVIMLFSLPFWAILQQLLTLLAIVALKHANDRDASSGLDHELITLASFIVVVLCCWNTMWFLSGLFSPVPAVDSQFEPEFLIANSILCWPQPDPFANDQLATTEALFSSRSESSGNFMRRLSWLGSVGLLVLGCISAYRWSSGDFAITSQIQSINVERLANTKWNESFPKVIGTWVNIGASQQIQRVDDYERALIVWNFAWQGQTIQLSVTLPFNTRPRLATGYEAVGWQVRSDHVRQFAPPKAKANLSIENGTELAPDEKIVFNELSIANELGGRAYALVKYHSLHDQVSKTELGDPENGAIKHGALKHGALEYQVLLFCESGEELTKQQFVELVSGFHLVNAKLIKEVEPRFRELIGTSKETGNE